VRTGPIEGEAAMYVRKSEIVTTLRSRGLTARADWVDRELPELVDAYKHSGLLATLHINPADLSPVATPTPSE
jgi:hypothetical protein